MTSMDQQSREMIYTSLGDERNNKKNKTKYVSTGDIYSMKAASKHVFDSKMSRKNMILSLSRLNYKNHFEFKSEARLKNVKCIENEREVQRRLGPGKYDFDLEAKSKKGRDFKFGKDHRFSKQGNPVVESEWHKMENIGPGKVRLYLGSYDHLRAVPDAFQNGYLDYIQQNPIMVKSKVAFRELNRLSPLGTKIRPRFTLDNYQYRSPMLIRMAHQTERRFFRPKTYQNEIGPGQHDITREDISSKIKRNNMIQMQRSKDKANGIGVSKRSVQELEKNIVVIGTNISIPHTVHTNDSNIFLRNR